MESIQEEVDKGYLDSFAYNCPIDTNNIKDLLHCKCYRNKRARVGNARRLNKDCCFFISNSYSYLNNIMDDKCGQCSSDDVISVEGDGNYDE